MGLVPEGALLDNTVRVQPHVFPTRVVVDIICTLANGSGINGWGKAGFGLDGDIHHLLVTSGTYDDMGCETYDYVQRCASRSRSCTWVSLEGRGLINYGFDKPTGAMSPMVT